MPASTGQRAAQLAATRARLLTAAIDVLRSDGVSGLSTAAVQRRAGVSRGALLHHFPSHRDLVNAVIDALVRRNEQAVEQALEASRDDDPIARGIRVLMRVGGASGEATIERELWIAARTDESLRAALIDAERRAGRDLNRVMARVFGPELSAHPNFPVFTTMTLALIRGLALGQVLRRTSSATDAAIEQWTALATTLLSEHAQPTPTSDHAQPKPTSENDHPTPTTTTKRRRAAASH